MFVSDFIGDEVRSRNLLPDCVSHREISPIEPIVARTRPSLLKSESTGALSGTIVCNSFPDLTSQIFTAPFRIGALEDIAVSGFGPYVTTIMVASFLNLARSNTPGDPEGVRDFSSRPVSASKSINTGLLALITASNRPSGLGIG